MVARVLSAGETALLERLPANVRAAQRLLQEKGLPTRRVEQWKYSDLRAAFDENVQFTVRPTVDEPAAEAAATRGDYIAMLAGAFGATEIVRVAKGEHVVRTEHVRSGFAPRALSVVLAPGAEMTRVVIQEAQGGVALDTARVEVGEGARYRQFTLAEGGKLARLETHLDIAGEKAEVTLGGVYLVGAGRHADLTSVIHHRAEGGQTRQLIKGAARKGGRGVFQGRIEVARGAQKTDARQYHHGLLLEDGAEIYAKPELEIYADDVQCAHGNTAGALDEAALFYMRTRGIGEAQGRAMLTEAFLIEAVPEDIPEREEIVVRIRAWLGGVS
jgi:Fe-S cluster assembly protein SufD